MKIYVKKGIVFVTHWALSTFLLCKTPHIWIWKGSKYVISFLSYLCWNSLPTSFSLPTDLDMKWKVLYLPFHIQFICIIRIGIYRNIMGYMVLIQITRECKWTCRGPLWDGEYIMPEEWGSCWSKCPPEVDFATLWEHLDMRLLRV
jgi:hypothetical protein